MKVLHVIPSFYPAHVYGGPMQSVYHLCRGLRRQGCDVRVLTTNANGQHDVLPVETDREMVLEDDLPVRYCARIAPDTVSPSMLSWLPHYIKWADVVHLTAVYSFPIIPTLAAAKFFGKPVVWSPRGMLQRWDGSTRTGLKAVWERVCQTVAPHGMVIHVTSEMEDVASRERIHGFETCVIPNGAEVVTSTPSVAQSQTSDPNGKQLRLLYIGRLHHKKGIENLLTALARLRDELKDSTPELTIAGTGDERYVASLAKLIENLNLTGQARMIGEVVGEEKERVYAEADVVVVPSHVENFGMVVAEALARGVPVIASTGTPWQRMQEVGAGLWVDNDPASLALAVKKIAEMPRREMGERGRELVRQEFSWDGIAAQMQSLYRELIGGQSEIHESQEFRENFVSRTKVKPEV